MKKYKNLALNRKRENIIKQFKKDNNKKKIKMII